MCCRSSTNWACASQCTLSGDARFHEVQTMHRAKVGYMVVCAKALLNVARKMEDNFGIPFFEGSFYGVQDMNNALRDFARIIGDADLIARTEAVIAREEASPAPRSTPGAERLTGKRVLLYTGGVKSWSIVSALQDLGMKVVATGTKKSTEEDKARIRELMGDDTKMIDDGSPKALLSTYHEYKADILIAGAATSTRPSRRAFPSSTSTRSGNSAAPVTPAWRSWPVVAGAVDGQPGVGVGASPRRGPPSRPRHRARCLRRSRWLKSSNPRRRWRSIRSR